QPIRRQEAGRDAGPSNADPGRQLVSETQRGARPEGVGDGDLRARSKLGRGADPRGRPLRRTAMTTATDTVVARAAALLLRSHSGIAFTGAGVSVESGIPHFRGEGGVWTRFDPYKLAHIDTFRKDPAQYWTYSLNHSRSDAERNTPRRAPVQPDRLGHLRPVAARNPDAL